LKLCQALLGLCNITQRRLLYELHTFLEGTDLRRTCLMPAG